MGAMHILVGRSESQGISSECDRTPSGDHNLLRRNNCETIRLQPALCFLVLVLEDQTWGDLGKLLHCSDHSGDFRVLQRVHYII